MSCNPIEKINQVSDIYSSYEGEEKITWCSGCGNYSIQNATKLALSLEKITPDQVVMCFDVGCNGNGSDKIKANTIHGLHGRVISLAAGVSLANPDLKVIASAGDGATYSEGINHLVHAIRNDYKMLFIQHNNSLYALTTGQPSATTPKGYPLNSAPDGVLADPINPVEVVLSLNPTFVARTFSGDLEHMTETLRKALNHSGFAFVEVLQVCPTYNRQHSQNWFWDRIRRVEEDPNYDPCDLRAAKLAAMDLDQQIAVGVLYHKPIDSFMDRLINRKGISTKPLEEVKHFDVSGLMKSLV